jgi:hypothetical protein
MSIPKSHLARTVPQVHDHVELERNGGNLTTEKQVAVGRK